MSLEKLLSALGDSISRMLVSMKRFVGNNWHGLLPPQYILSRRRFKRVVLDPPDLEPGSWRGAGKALVDYDSGLFWMTTRPRRATPIRGYAVEIYRSRDGDSYDLATVMDKETVSSMAGITVNSIEGQQLLRDPSTGRYHLYLSVDTPPAGWATLLLVADDPKGPWESRGIVMERGPGFDSMEARDATIDIVDGRYFALYKASDGERIRMALATSGDGVRWRKHGLLRLDGLEQPPALLLCGKILAGSLGPIFMGCESRAIVRGAMVGDTFAAYAIDHRGMNLERIFAARWDPRSPYERGDFPIHSYLDMVYDPFKDRLLMYVEAIDPKDIGLNQEVDRVLLYEVSLDGRTG